MAKVDTDRNLLFGILALQTNFIDRDQLLAAFNDWVSGKARPLGKILLERNALSAAEHTLLEALVAAHLNKYQSDPQKSLAALGAIGPARRELEQIADPDLHASLAHVTGERPEEGDPLATQTFVGTLSSSGFRFRVLRPHAKGGLGAVFVALDEELHREVALKEIHDKRAHDPESRSRFVLEAEITGSLEHPGVVPVYGLGRYADGRPFYAMRFIRGNSLDDAIKRFHQAEGASRDPGERALAVRQLLGRFIDVCNTIAYAHSRGVLHRDLKPANIMLGKFGETLVVDWGLAKAQGKTAATQEGGEDPLQPSSGDGSAATQAGSAIGTPQFMSPEQAEGKLERLGPACDVYSLGATLYCILTGKPPVEDPDVGVVLRKVAAGDFPVPRQVAPKVPAALEAVCLKAMALRPVGRYASAHALAGDIEQWLADEPVSAWQEPFLIRARRWVSRHRTPVSAGAAALVVGLAAGGYFLYEDRLRSAREETQRLAMADGRVDALITAQVSAIPGIIKELGADRRLVRDRLRHMARGSGPYADPRRPMPGALVLFPEDGQEASLAIEAAARLPAALALLQDDSTQASFLVARLLEPETAPDEVLVIRDALVAHGPADRLAAQFREKLAGKPADLTEAQLRAAGALAKIAPADPLWPALAEPIARKLVQENPLFVGTWREVFEPIASSLNEPLRRVYANLADAEPRDRAFTLLFEFANRALNPRQNIDLLELIADADPARFRQVLRRLDTGPVRDQSIAWLIPKIQSPARFDDALARRQGRWAMALLQLKQPETAWPLFRHRDDPSLRTDLIHNLARFGFDPALVVERLGSETDVSARRALILCVGEFSPTMIPAPAREALTERLLSDYRANPDPGLHGAIDWLLRQRWGLGKDLGAIDKELASPDLPKDRNWFVNGQGQTFAILRGEGGKAIEFQMGSTPQSDPVRDPDEVAHLCRIERSFAIALREVIVREYARFLEDKPEDVKDWRENEQFKQSVPSADCAIGVVTWWDAAKYCNWLSQKEGIDEAQWCFPKTIGPGMKLPSDYLERHGYRLPTEAEWEYACRAGAVSSRSYGRSDDWLSEYGWYLANSSRKMHAAGEKKPNDFGLFDSLGNAAEWCVDPYFRYPAAKGTNPVVDAVLDAEFTEETVCVMRGGPWFGAPADLRSADRTWYRPASQNATIGFRPVRTCP